MSDLPGLIVPLEARVDKLEKGFAKANAIQKRASGQMERRASQSAKRMQASYGRAGDAIVKNFKRLGPALGVSLAVGGLKGLSSSLNRVVSDVAAIGDAAKTAGVDLEAFQELRFVSDQNRIGVDAMIDGLKEMNLRADEFVITGGGPAAEAFRRLNLTSSQLAEGLKKPDKLFEDIIEKMQGLDDAAQIRIADEIFGGTAAEQFTALISKGADAIRATRREARDTGAVLDSELIEKAAELDKRFAALKTRTDVWFKSLVVGIADAAPKISEFGGYIDNLFDDNTNRTRSILGDDIASQLSKDARAVEAHRSQIEALARVYDETGFIATRNATRLAKVADELRQMGQTDAANKLDAVAAEMQTLTDKLDAGTIGADEFEKGMADATDTATETLTQVNAIDGVNFSYVIKGLGRLVTALSTAATKARELRATLPGGRVDGETDAPTYDDPGPRTRNGHRAATPGLAVTTSTRPTLPSMDASFGTHEPSSGGGGRGGGGASARQSDLERELESIAEETAALRIEAAALAEVSGARIDQGDALDFARTRAELLAAAQRSGVAITPQLKAQIDTLAQGYVQAGTAAETAADKIAEIQNASKNGADSIASVFQGLATGALTAEQAIGQLLIQIIKMSLQKRIMEAASGAGGSVFGSILKVIGGGFSEGGWTGPGSKLEPAGVVHKDEFVFSKQSVKAIGVPQLEALHRSAKGYSGGGFVGGNVPRLNPANTSQAPSISVTAPITIQGRNESTPEQDAALSKSIGREMEGVMRGVIVDELRRQGRPGNMLSRGGRR